MQKGKGRLRRGALQERVPPAEEDPSEAHTRSTLVKRLKTKSPVHTRRNEGRHVALSPPKKEERGTKEEEQATLRNSQGLNGCSRLHGNGGNSRGVEPKPTRPWTWPSPRRSSAPSRGPCRCYQPCRRPAPARCRSCPSGFRRRPARSPPDPPGIPACP